MFQRPVKRQNYAVTQERSGGPTIAYEYKLNTVPRTATKGHEEHRFFLAIPALYVYPCVLCAFRVQLNDSVESVYLLLHQFIDFLSTNNASMLAFCFCLY